MKSGINLVGWSDRKKIEMFIDVFGAGIKHRTDKFTYANDGYRYKFILDELVGIHQQIEGGWLKIGQITDAEMRRMNEYRDLQEM